MPSESAAPPFSLSLKFVLQDIIRNKVCACGGEQGHVGWMRCACDEAGRVIRHGRTVR